MIVKVSACVAYTTRLAPVAPTPGDDGVRVVAGPMRSTQVSEPAGSRLVPGGQIEAMLVTTGSRHFRPPLL